MWNYTWYIKHVAMLFHLALVLHNFAIPDVPCPALSRSCHHLVSSPSDQDFDLCLANELMDVKRRPVVTERGQDRSEDVSLWELLNRDQEGTEGSLGLVRMGVARKQLEAAGAGMRERQTA